MSLVDQKREKASLKIHHRQRKDSFRLSLDAQLQESEQKQKQQLDELGQEELAMKSHIKAFKVHTKAMKQNRRIQMKQLGETYKARMKADNEGRIKHAHALQREESFEALRNAAIFQSEIARKAKQRKEISKHVQGVNSHILERQVEETLRKRQLEHQQE